MNQHYFKIQHIPAILWGEKSDRVLIAVHGNLSRKDDTVIELLAKAAEKKGFQTLSFDLPEHGERKGGETLCKVQACVQELHLVMEYAKTRFSAISLFGCSIGAYFGLLAYGNEPVEKAIFLAPVLDMERVINGMMAGFGVSEEHLEKEQVIATPIGQTLYWDYLCYVREHPITQWGIPTAILRGTEDDLCDRAVVSAFAEKFPCEVTELEQGGHFFYTPEQLEFYTSWLESTV